MGKENFSEDDKKAMETIVEAVTEKTVPLATEKAVEAVIAKMKADKPLRKDIFGDEDTSSEKTELAERKSASAEYLRKLATGKDTKALSAGVSTSGAEMVPTYVSDNVIGVAQNYGLIRKNAVKWPMQGINENIPTISTVQAYRLASDTSGMTASQPTTGAVTLRAKTVGVMIPISKVLLQNATSNLVDAITFLAGKAIAKLEDQWGLLGLGAGEGVFQSASVPVVTMASGDTTYAKITPEYLLDVENLLDENFSSNKLRWAMSRSVLNVLRAQRNAVGADKQGFLLPGYGGDTPPTLWEHPYDTTDIMPKTSVVSQAATKFLALIDYENVIHGDAMQYTMEISDQATIVDTDGSTAINTFQQNMVAIKIWGLIDIQLSNPTKAFGVLKTHA